MLSLTFTARRSVRAFATAASKAAGVSEVTTPPRKQQRRRARPAPLTVTQNAADRITELMSNQDTAIGVRLGVKARGCNGLSYTLNYAEEADPSDEEVADKGVRIFVDSKALFYVVGTVMDYEVTKLSAEFTFNNPNSKGECGCGESFHV